MRASDRNLRLGALLGALCLTLGGCDSGGGPDELVVAAAASLRDVLGETAPLFEAEHPGVRLVFSFDASSSLARQIQAGAGFDVFLSADGETLARVLVRCVPGSARPILAGELVVARRSGGAPLDALADLLGSDGPIAVAGEAVPAGRYARELLRARGLWDGLAARVVTASNVRAALGLIESGAAEFAFVYRTDLARARGARLAWAAGPGTVPVRWYGALLARDPGAPRDHRSAAARFLAFLDSEPFLERARALGFLDVGER